MTRTGFRRRLGDFDANGLCRLYADRIILEGDTAGWAMRAWMKSCVALSGSCKLALMLAARLLATTWR